jgi:hypothetical protein
MGAIKDITFGVFFGAIISMIIMKIGDIVFKDNIYDQKVQNLLGLYFISGLLCIALGSYLTNVSLKFGFTTSGFILLFYVIFGNWDQLSESSKLLILILSLALLIKYAFLSKKKDQKQEIIDEIKEINDYDEDLSDEIV